ncbi:MAG: hypothetical protein EOP61_10175, partial [Sphingomonadales bacterium]
MTWKVTVTETAPTAVPLSEGSYTLTAIATDGGNSSGVASSNFSVNVPTPNAPVVTTPAAGATTSGNMPTYSGTAEASSTVTILVDGTAIGTTTATGSGNWNFTPVTPLADGSHAVTATATNGAGKTSSPSTAVVFTVDTTAPNAPVITAPADGAVVTTLTPTFTGSAEAGATVTISVDGSVAGTAVANGSNSWSMGSAPLGQGTHIVKARATDTVGNSSADSAPNTFEVALPPIAADRSGVAVAYGSTGAAIDLSGSITGVHASIAIGTPPAHGTVSVAGDVVTYTPDASYYGADGFTYMATGPGGTSSAAAVSLSVATPAAPVVANKAGVAVPYESTGTAIDLSASITGVHASIAIGTGPAHGTVTVAGDVATYTPGPGNFGADSFTYTATGPGGTSASATVSLTIDTPAAPVVANKTGVAIAYDSTGTAIDLSPSITGVRSSIAVGAAPTHGTTSIAGEVVTYIPAAGYYGADSFTYTATGPGGTSAPATVSLAVAAPAAPVAASKSGVAVAYNSAGTAIDLSASVSGVHSGIAIATTPAHGTVTIAGDVVTYIPTSAYFGADSFTYTATGPGGTSPVATVSLTVATPAAPVAIDKEGVAVSYASSGTAINLSASVSGVHTSIVIGTAPAHGIAMIAGDVVTYTPNAGYFGVDSFTFTATGPGGTSVPATVSLTVATPAAPVASDKEGVAVPYASTGTAIDLSASINGVHTGIAIGTAPSHGTVTIAGDVVTFTPAATYYGADSFTYVATGPGGNSAPATVSLTVSTPAAPVAANASAAVPFNGTGTAIDLSASISGVHTSIAMGTAPAHGTATITGHVVTYTPAASYYGADSFTYVATGPGGSSAPATVTLTVAIPAAPVAADATAAVPFNSAGTPVSLASSITGVHASVAISAAPAHGTVAVADAVVTYTPTAGFFGTDSFMYTATGPGGTSPAAMVTISVATPPAPTVTDKSGVAVGYNGSGTAIDLSGSITGLHTLIQIGTAPSHGTAAIAGSVVTYTPTAGYFGADSFTYKATGPGGTSSAATVSLTVATPAAPVVADRLGIAVPYASTGTAVDLSASISGVHSSIAVRTTPEHGTVTIAGDVVTYVPPSTYFGADSFTYTATGPGGTSAPAMVSLTVATPAAPVAADKVGVAVPYASTGTAIDLSASLSGVRTSIAIGTAPVHGAVTIAGDVVTYTPAATYFGADSFTYTATGPGGTSASASVLLTVATPATPVAADKAGVAVPYASTGTAIDLSASVSGVHTSIAISTAPVHGTVTITGDVVTYTPAATYFGTDSFTYTAAGPGGTSAPAMVSLMVATPAAPVASDKGGVAVPYASTGTAIDLSASITGVHASIAIGIAPAHGTLAITGDVVTYTPSATYFGADSFTYVATGPGGSSAPATVSLTVATPAAPVAADATAAVPFNSLGMPINLAPSIAGVHTSIAIGTAPAHGTATIAGDVVTYIPTAGYFGTDSFTYTATGPGGASPAAMVTISVATPPAPTVTDKSGVAVDYNGSGTAIDLSSSIGGVHTLIQIGTTPAHGATSIAGDVVTYTPVAGYFGADSFTYTATGPGGTSAPASVSVTVATPAAPVAADKDGVAIAYNSAGTAIDLSASITGVHARIQIGTQPAHGAVSVAGDVVTFTPAAGYFGADSFTYTATGPGGTSNAATVRLTVANPPPPVTAPATGTVAGSSSVTSNNSVAVDLSALVTGEYSSIVIETPPAHGTVTLSSIGATGERSGGQSALALPRVMATYRPVTGYAGMDSFTFAAVGPGGRSAPATITVTVIGSAPVAQAKTAITGDGETVTVNLTAGATEGPFTGATVVNVAPANSATTRIVDSGTDASRTFSLEVTPNARFSGNVVVTYTLTNGFGTSAPATVTIGVTARPNPTADATIRGVSDAQAETTRRFARSQVANFMRRSEQLHGGGNGGAAMGVTLNSRDGRTVRTAPPLPPPCSCSLRRMKLAT